MFYLCVFVLVTVFPTRALTNEECPTANAEWDCKWQRTQWSVDYSLMLQPDKIRLCSNCLPAKIKCCWLRGIPESEIQLISVVNNCNNVETFHRGLTIVLELKCVWIEVFLEVSVYRFPKQEICWLVHTDGLERARSTNKWLWLKSLKLLQANL